MKIWQFAVLTFLLTVLCIFSVVNALPILAPANAAVKVKWEYKIGAVPDETFEQDVNRAGDEGWELVFARRASSGERGDTSTFAYEMIFKRVK